MGPHFFAVEQIGNYTQPLARMNWCNSWWKKLHPWTCFSN